MSFERRCIEKIDVSNQKDKQISRQKYDKIEILANNQPVVHESAQIAEGTSLADDKIMAFDVVKAPPIYKILWREIDYTTREHMMEGKSDATASSKHR